MPASTPRRRSAGRRPARCPTVNPLAPSRAAPSPIASPAFCSVVRCSVLSDSEPFSANRCSARCLVALGVISPRCWRRSQPRYRLISTSPHAGCLELALARDFLSLVTDAPARARARSRGLLDSPPAPRRARRAGSHPLPLSPGSGRGGAWPLRPGSPPRCDFRARRHPHPPPTSATTAPTSRPSRPQGAARPRRPRRRRPRRGRRRQTSSRRPRCPGPPGCPTPCGRRRVPPSSPTPRTLLPSSRTTSASTTRLSARSGPRAVGRRRDRRVHSRRGRSRPVRPRAQHPLPPAGRRLLGRDVGAVRLDRRRTTQRRSARSVTRSSSTERGSGFEALIVVTVRGAGMGAGDGALQRLHPRRLLRRARALPHRAARGRPCGEQRVRAPTERHRPPAACPTSRWCPCTSWPETGSRASDERPVTLYWSDASGALQPVDRTVRLSDGILRGTHPAVPLRPDQRRTGCRALESASTPPPLVGRPFDVVLRDGRRRDRLLRRSSLPQPEHLGFGRQRGLPAPAAREPCSSSRRVDTVEYRIGGSCEAFWIWLGRTCTTVTRDDPGVCRARGRRRPGAHVPSRGACRDVDRVGQEAMIDRSDRPRFDHGPDWFQSPRGDDGAAGTCATGVSQTTVSGLAARPSTCCRRRPRASAAVAEVPRLSTRGGEASARRRAPSPAAHRPEQLETPRTDRAPNATAPDAVVGGGGTAPAGSERPVPGWISADGQASVSPSSR